MTTIETKIFSFKELSPESQAKVIQDRIEDAQNDDYLLEYDSQEMLDGETVSRAFDKVAYRFGQILENQLDYLTSEEYIKELIDEDEEIYTEDGEVFN